MSAASPPEGGAARTPWWFSATVVGAVALAAATRVGGLAERGLSSDEVVYLQQGADLVGGGSWTRAHPPLFGLLLQLVPAGAESDTGPRAAAVGIGLAAIVVAGLLGRELAGPAAGASAAVLLACMPYHADVTRLALVDVPMATLSGLGVLLAVRASRDASAPLATAAAAVLAVATLVKETAVLTAAAVLIAALRADPRFGRRTLVRCTATYLMVVSLYPITLVARGSLSTGAAYLAWQLGRGRTEPATFYLMTVLPRIGPPVVLAGLVGTVLLLRAQPRPPGTVLVVLGVAVPVTFYIGWPVRGYPYLLAVMVPLTALGGAGVALGARAAFRRWRGAAAVAIAAAVVAAGATRASAEPPDVPGASGVPGIRETARWISGRERMPVVTAAPWVGTVLRHYLGGASVHALTTPVADARANPAYPSQSVSRLPSGPSLVVWDVWSAAADPAGTARLLELVRQRKGRVAHVETATIGGSRRVALVAFVVAP